MNTPYSSYGYSSRKVVVLNDYHYSINMTCEKRTVYDKIHDLYTIEQISEYCQDLQSTSIMRVK